MKPEDADSLAALKKEVEELKRFAFRLSEDQREYEMRFEALRALLLQLGTISRADFEAALAEIVNLGKGAFELSLEASHQEESRRRLELLREMLQKHEGTKQ